MLPRIIRADSEESSRVSRFIFTSAAAGTSASPGFPSASLNAPAPEKFKPPIIPSPVASRPSANSAAVPSATPEQQSEHARIKNSELEREGYEKGFGEGEKAGYEASELAAESLLKQYSERLEELNKLRRDVFANSEREVIRLAVEIARKIIKREVTIDEELILTLVKVALKRVSHQALVTIRVNPKDYLCIERNHAARPEAGLLSETMKLIEDPQIARGGCVIETESGTIDARIEEQLREVEKGFFE